MKKILLLASIVVLIASCSLKPKLDLEVNINNNNTLINKNFIVTYQVEGRTVYTDTVIIKKDNFSLKIPLEGKGLINIAISETRIRFLMLAAEKGKVNLTFDGLKPYFSGTPLNDRLQAFYNGNDSIYSLYSELNKEYELISGTDKYSLQKDEEISKKRTQLLIENTDRIVAFIKENVDNPVGEYYFMTNYLTFPPERKLELNSFATEKLKKEFNIK